LLHSVVSPSMKKGLLIVLEGIDGSGKATQTRLLYEYLEERNVACSLVSFPCYDGHYGRLVARYLNGEFGDVFQVSPYFSSLPYAGDRLEHRDRLLEKLKTGEIVVVDRYVASNVAHQGAKLPMEQRADFVNWIEELEYTIHGIPRENLVFYCRIPVSLAQQLVDKKDMRQYTAHRRDIHERDATYLHNVCAQYDWLAQRYDHWESIEAVDPEGRLRNPEAVHKEIVHRFERRFAL
jgi:dTMP kinase